MKKYFILIFIMVCSVFSFGQASIRDSAIRLSIASISYSYKIPGGDLAKRFYPNSSIGGSYLFKTKKNWFIGADGFFIFRDKIKETGVLDSISTPDGSIIDGNGNYADVRLYERGFYIGLKLGKMFPVWGPNKNSGIVILCGPGFLQHKIRIENPGNEAPQVDGDYKKGYDRLTNGFALNEFIGYMYLGSRKLINFYAGIDLTQAWTKNRRFNFDLMDTDNSKRFDILSGITIGWVIPIYRRSPNKYYYH